MVTRGWYNSIRGKGITLYIWSTSILVIAVTRMPSFFSEPWVDSIHAPHTKGTAHLADDQFLWQGWREVRWRKEFACAFKFFSEGLNSWQLTPLF